MSSIPKAGFRLGSAPSEFTAQDSEYKQVFLLKFQEQKTLEELVNAATPIRLSLGKNKNLTSGKLAYGLVPSNSDKYRSELYSFNGGRDLKCTGLITNVFRVNDQSKHNDQAAAELAAQFSALKQDKLAKQTKKVDQSSLIASGKSKWSKWSLKDESSASMNSSQRTGDGSISPSLASTRKKKRKVQAEELALKHVLMYLLALGPDSEKNLATKVRSSPEFCNDVILRHKLANRTGMGNKWILVDDIYKELDFWSFPYPDDKTRKIAIDNAMIAFEKLRVPDDSEVRQKLLSPEDRGKVPPPTLKKAKTPPSITVTDASKTSTSAQASPTFPKTTGGEAMARSVSNPLPPKKKYQDPISRMIANKGKPKPAPKAAAKGRPPKEKKEPTTKAAPKKAATKAGAASSKIKSADFVTESDDEMVFQTSPKRDPAPSSAASSVTRKADSDVEMKDAPPLPPPSRATVSPVKRKASPVVKSTPTSKASTLKKDAAPSLAPKKTEVVSRPNVASKTPAASGKITKPASKSVSKVNGTKRPSPPESARYSPAESISKPSPLGTSQPVTASDFDNSVTSPSSASSSPAFTNSRSTDSPYGRYSNTAAQDLKRKRAHNEEDSSKRSRIRIDDNILAMAKQFKAQHAKYLQKFEAAKRLSNPRLREERLREVGLLEKKLIEMKANITKATEEQQREYELSARKSNRR